jgi:hypothetical protein
MIERIRQAIFAEGIFSALIRLPKVGEIRIDVRGQDLRISVVSIDGAKRHFLVANHVIEHAFLFGSYEHIQREVIDAFKGFK